MAPNTPPKLSSLEAYISNLEQKLKRAKKDVGEKENTITRPRLLSRRKKNRLATYATAGNRLPSS